MTISEFIGFWDSVSVSEVPIVFYYKNVRTPKSYLYNINQTLNAININYTYEDLRDEHISIYHENLDFINFSYDQKNFYENLRIDLPKNLKIYTINFYLD